MSEESWLEPPSDIPPPLQKRKTASIWEGWEWLSLALAALALAIGLGWRWLPSKPHGQPVAAAQTIDATATCS